ncbi:MAG TPA: DNA polymerase I [Candidatus Omnitrophota bacterium]|nr:DNA polymerase I [Candidatus Omnitrophota bacterium]HRY85043.1 DNA polymerase I [Candidatus Omnitrophota bacterium]
MAKRTPERNPREGKLFLIDGHSLCYRAFYAIPGLTNSKGEPTNAIYGFVTMLRKLMEEQKPDHAAVCFDRREPTFRHEQYKEYKAHRKPMPEELVSQIEPIKEFCRISKLAVFEKAGYEADDVIGTLALRGKQEGYRVFIITGDKDAFQLVDEKVKILQPHKENKVYDAAAVRERFGGLGPDKVVDILALMGDASDNIPGVPGIGEKTAIKLMQEFGSVEGLLKGLEKLSSEKQRQKIQENMEELQLSQKLATIDTDVSLEIDWDKIRVTEPDNAALTEFFKRYEFRGLLKSSAPQGEKGAEKRNYKAVTASEELQILAEKLKKIKAFSFDTETTSSDPMRAALVGMSFCWEPLTAYYVPVSSSLHQGPGLSEKDVLKALKSVLEDEKIAKYGQNIKYDEIVMARHGIRLAGVAFDTMIASYLIDPVKRNHNLDDISLEYLDVKKIPTESLIGSGKKSITMDVVPLETITAYACEDADCVLRLVPILEAKLKEFGLTELYKKTELPLSGVLAKVEMNGVALDLEFLKKLSEKATGEIAALVKDIYADAGTEFNLDSPKQLADILFVQKKLPAFKKIKTGYSTDAGVLEKLALSHELPRKILEYRERAKLKSTYLDALPEMVNPQTHCVHTSFNQTTTDTGRLSSSEPNLQNIPIKTEMGRLIRKAFVPRSRGRGKGKILSADYSQIELRILAHFSEDPNLTKAFEEDRDIHAYTATLLYGVKEKDVTREMRNAAKTINFSIVYGKTSYGLSQDLHMSISEADEFIKNYFSRYPKIKEFLDGQKEKAKKEGYLTTILGRRSYFPNIHASNVQLRQYAERAAINAPLQGSAADLIKIAMIAIQSRLEKEKSQSLMIIQVHDELVFDAPAAEVDALTRLVREEMEGAYKLKVPLKADVFSGDTWYKN